MISTHPPMVHRVFGVLCLLLTVLGWFALFAPAWPLILDIEKLTSKKSGSDVACALIFRTSTQPPVLGLQELLLIAF
jgi:hypothetical protein